MQVLLNINGYETPVEFPTNMLPVATIKGSKENYSISYGSYMEVGGIVDIQVTNGEGNKVVNLPFNVLDFQATAIDNNTGSIQESCHIEFVNDNTVRVYGRATSDGTIKVKWYAKGV